MLAKVRRGAASAAGSRLHGRTRRLKSRNVARHARRVCRGRHGQRQRGMQRTRGFCDSLFVRKTEWISENGRECTITMKPIGGIVAGILTAAGFAAGVQTLLAEDGRTAFVITFEDHVVERDKLSN